MAIRGRGLELLGQGILGASQQFAKLPGAIAEEKDIKALQELLSKPQVREFVDIAFEEGKKLQGQGPADVTPPFAPRVGIDAMQGPQEPPKPVLTREQKEVSYADLPASEKQQLFASAGEGRKKGRLLESQATAVVEQRKAIADELEKEKSFGFDSELAKIRSELIEKTSSKGGGTRQAELELTQNRPDLVEAFKEDVDAIVELGWINEKEGEILKSQGERNVIQADNRLGKRVENIGGGIIKEQILRPERVETATAKKEAGEKVKKQLSEKENSELLDERGYIRNLSNAQKEFKDRFATKYLGKSLKLVSLRQNDPEFAKFMTSLASFANEYRNSLFGASLTQGEMSAFEDVINPNLNSSPEVLKQQIDKVTNIITSKHKDRLKSLDSIRLIPENFKTIPGEKLESDDDRKARLRKELLGG
jgi:hypothetical protein